MTPENRVSPWQFTDDQGSFRLDNPHHTSYLYFPLVNEAGMMSSITPTLHGDAKTGQNEFLMSPVSVEDLHNTRSARNFWVTLPGYAPWSATGNSARQHAGSSDSVTLDAGMLWHKVTRENKEIGLRAEITSFVPMSGDQVELMKVVLTNVGSRALPFTPTAAIPIFGRSADNLRDHRHVTSLLHRTRTHACGVLVHPTLSFDERGHTLNQITYGVLGVEQDGAAPMCFFPAVEDFIGEGGSFDWPQAVIDTALEGVPAGQTLDGYETVGALRFADVTLQPGQSCEYVLILAVMRGSADPDTLIDTYGSSALFDAALAECKAYWQAKADALTLNTADPAFDRWMKWVTIQPVLRRMFGNSFLPYHDYGRGGRGWRDLWQDCLALLLTAPEDVEGLLYSSFAGVRIDGSNATIIGREPGQFVADRNNIPRVWMDHGTWPYLTARLYVDQSGDLAFLLRDQDYFKDPQINRCKGLDAQWSPDQGTRLRAANGDIYRGTILEHILVQHLTSFFHVGEHNILKTEGADWNDAMDMARNRGESVAFTALYAGNLRDLSALIPELGKLGVTEVELAAEVIPLLDTLRSPVDYDDVAAKQAHLDAYFQTCQHCLSGEKVRVALRDLSNDLAAKADWLYDHLRRQEWVADRTGHGWFNGYYDDDGSRVEGDHPNGVRMTLTGQVFTLMNGIATAEQVESIVRAADHYLLEPKMGGYRLNTDFGGIQLNLGRGFGFAFGHKENGAMFSHMAVMYANALYRRGKAREGYKALDNIYRQCADFAASRIYPGIPEYITPRGRGMYTYLTGSASWLLLTVVTEVFGVKGVLGNLALAPRLLGDQFDAKGWACIETLFAGRRLDVTYHNPARLDAGHYTVQDVTLDGVIIPFERAGEGVVIPREVIASFDAKFAHELVVQLG